VLIGENDSGKTAIIDAIKLILKTHSYEWLRITEDDFHENADRLRIELTLENFSDNEASHFTEWLGWKIENDIRKPYLRLIYDVSRNTDRILPADVHAGADDEGHPLTADAREYLKITYLKPLRDAGSEFAPKKNSRISQILQAHDAFKGQNDSHYLVKLFNKFNLSIEKYFDGKQPKSENDDEFEDISDLKGKELKEKIDEFIHAIYDKSKQSRFSVAEGNLKIILEKLELSIAEEFRPGLGTLNRLFIASELLHLDKPNWDGLRLGLIEELEAHLHPQAQMQIIEYLQSLKNIQIILTTHSPNLASKVKLENVIFCKGNIAFPMGSNYTYLDSSDYTFLEIFLDTTKSNLFFAKGVIFVEGWAEEILVPALARKLGLDLTSHGVSTVNVAGTAFLRYAKIFQRKQMPNVGIPVSIITDLDIMPREEDTMLNGKSRREMAIENAREKYESDDVKTFVSRHWTLEYCIFKSLILSQKFQEIAKSIHTRTDWTNFESALMTKLSNGDLNKTGIAYALANFLNSDCNSPQPEIKFDKSDPAIEYLLEAIKHACAINNQR